MKKFILFLSLLFSIFQTALAQKTEIWIVRHAEKGVNNPNDPDLSDKGKKRAEDLAVILAKFKFDAAFSTPYKRTHQTLDPLAKKNKISITDYKSITTLVDDIRKNYSGKKIIIAGHSNTVLETIEAFGIQRPKAKITDDEFNNIFHLTLNGNKTELKTNTYGKI
ncbi:phosphoglycerate mutase family protein [Pedobacter frigoris]|uniref:Histidine phosphatase family protein n=1 Tax=Pedobacter frigoris TaxID=2571272 RepID=A0A4U1CTV3_9SPHI|nr:phosphoglycerate mutase family protein [Pedobacter frigoris]TKC09409.1 histidine phosphatase family protein [Pedobacter frigoris]